MKAPIGLLVTALLAILMVGCTPSVQPTPDPPSASSTPTPTPSPQWTAEEQAAVNAVARYLEVWAGITQKLPDVDRTPIRDVTGDPLRSQIILDWKDMAARGWRLEGTPTLVPTLVTPGAHDYQGDRYHVLGCYTDVDTFIVDKDGTHLDAGLADNQAVEYLVLHLKEGQYLVLDEKSKDKPC